MSVRNQSDNLLPDPTDLYELLVSELEYLKNQPGTLAENAKQFNIQYQELKSNDKNDWKLDISPNWAIPIGGSSTHGSTNTQRDFAQKGFALIGGLIDVDDGLFKEYSLNLTLLAQHDTEVRSDDGSILNGTPCCWNEITADDWRVAKRYHFDIDVDDDGKHEPKPVTHLQSGGKFKEEHVPNHRSDLAPHYCHTPVDKPRLPHPPMDPILIIHLLVRQYYSLRNIVQDSWLSYVKYSEKILWRSYYSRVHQLLDEDENSRDTVDTLFDNTI